MSVAQLVRPRVRVCASSFWPDRNGVANAVLQQVRQMAAFVEVDVVTCTPGPDALDIAGTSVAVHRVTMRSQPRTGVVHAADALEVDRLFDAGEPFDVLVLHAWQTALTQAMLRPLDLKRLARRIVLASHGISTRARYHPPPLDALHRLSWMHYERHVLPRQLERVDDLVLLWDQADSDRFFDAALARRLGRPRVHVIPNATQWDGQEAVAPELEPALMERLRHGLLLSVGSYTYVKNEPMVLDAYCRSRRTLPLVFVGQRANAAMRSLQRDAARKGIGDVHFLHGMTKQHIDWLYSHARLLLVGSRTECQPLVILDAMAAGVPFVSTPVGCVPSLSGGIVVSDAAAMAEAIDGLLNDESARAGLGATGREHAARDFAPAQVAARWRALVTGNAT